MVEIIIALLPSIISIIGFILTYVGIKLSFKNEITKLKNEIHIEKMESIPYKVLDLMNNNEKGKIKAAQVTVKDFSELITTIYAYGSREAISIISLFQKENYSGELTTDKYRMIMFYVLLATQVKYDVTGISISPDFWLTMKLSDYTTSSENQTKFKEANNKIVDELNLNKKFKIK